MNVASRYWIFFLAAGVWWITFQVQATSMEASTSAVSSSYEENDSPLVQPQLSFLTGVGFDQKIWYKTPGENTELTVQIKNPKFYQLDYEISAHRFCNIGFDLRLELGEFKPLYFTEDGKKIIAEAKESDIKEDLKPHIHLATGAFIRMQYPLHRRVALFTRGELAFGPYISYLQGLQVDGVVQGGIDFYFNDWWGLTASYGVQGEYGIRTFKPEKSDPEIHSVGIGTFLLVGLKSTYL